MGAWWEKAQHVIRHSFWWMALMQGLQDATIRRPQTTLGLWAASLIAIFLVVRLSLGLDSAVDELRVTLLTGLALAAVQLSYYVLRIPPGLFKDAFREEMWRTMGDEFAKLQAEGLALVDPLKSDMPIAVRKQKRHEWRGKVLDLCAHLSPAWRSQFEYQGGMQKETLGLRIKQSMQEPEYRRKLPGTDVEYEFFIDFYTEVEQVKGFAKFCYDKAMALERLR